jgi:hypothetical protein
MLPDIPIERAIAIASDLARMGLKSKHQDYDRTVELARDYKAFITGKDMGHLYRRYDRRETEEDHKQAVRLSNPLTPQVCNALTQPLRKLANVPPKSNLILYEQDKDLEKTNQLRALVDSFHGDNDLATLFGQVFLEYGIMDPNAFALYTFDNYDNRYEKPYVYAEIQPAQDVWNFEYRADVLQWLWLHKTIQYVKVEAAQGQQVVKEDGHKFILYTPNHHIVFEQVRYDLVSVPQAMEGIIVTADMLPVVSPVFGPDAVHWFTQAGATYAVRFYDQKSKRVPALRLGYKKDAYTMGRTCVNLWHPAYYALMSLVKLGRENDLSYYLHTFLQKISYVPRCVAQHCNGGLLPDGGKCTVCKGEGKLVATTAQDHIEFALPARPDQNNLIDLEMLVKYVNLPTDILTIQDKKIHDTIAGAFKAVYNSDVYVVDTTADTATGAKIDMASVVDTLQDPAKWFSNGMMDSQYIIAAYNDLDDGLTVIWRLPRNFKLESTSEILELMKRMKEAGASTTIVNQLNDDLITLQFQDTPQQMERVRAMNRFDPFAGKTDDVIQYLLASDLTLKEDKVLWSNMPKIILEAWRPSRRAYRGKSRWCSIR